MSPQKRKQVDPLEQAIEAALSPGRFISYKAAWSFVDDVQNVSNDIEKIIQREPERAAQLFEAFIAACHEKADEIDDSSGNFGMLVDDLFRSWIKSRQIANADRDETASLLLAWMEDDPYGFWLVSRLRRATDEELEDFSHQRIEPLARKLERSQPGIAARVYRALCMWIVNAGKSKYYDAALDNIKHAKKCYAKAGLDTDWEAVVADVRERHFRKRGFMTGFEEFVSGAPKRVASSHIRPTRLHTPLPIHG